MEYCVKCGRPLFDDGMGMVPPTICECPIATPSITIQQKCPICEGHGIVPGGFYNSTPGASMISTASSEQCKNCNGIGVVHVTQ